MPNALNNASPAHGGQGNAAPSAPRVAIVGGGPAGLMAAEALLQARPGVQVDLYDAMPSLGRKFLLAGIGGLNLTHGEPLDAFTSRYAERATDVGHWLEVLGPSALRDWAAGLGISTFIGSSGRVFPAEMKAAPLLRAWLHRLRASGLRVHARERWLGWADGGGDDGSGGNLGGDGSGTMPTLRMRNPHGEHLVRARAVVLALGGASWPQLGSDGAWWPWLAERGVDVAPLQAANCGFELTWSPYFAQRFAGAPVKAVRLKFNTAPGQAFDRQGEFVITAHGIEGSLVYAASALLRDAITQHGSATVQLDLVPGRDEARLATALAKGRAARSLPNHLREHAGLDGVKAALLRERWSAAELAAWVAERLADLARELKAWPLTLTAPRPLAEAISTAGGVRLEALDEALMLRALPGVFCAGEMLDWEAPTGGYLLNACMASGRVAGLGAARWLAAASTAGHARADGHDSR